MMQMAEPQVSEAVDEEEEFNPFQEDEVVFDPIAFEVENIVTGAYEQRTDGNSVGYSDEDNFIDSDGTTVRN